jgi:hypothetical protein
MKRILLVALAIVALGLLACGGSSAPKQVHTLHGSISLKLGSPQIVWNMGQPCSGTGGYSDMSGGAEVEVRNGDGIIIATGHLNQGIGTDPSSTDLKTATTCIFSFDIDGVPDTDFYSVEVNHRGGTPFPKSEMESNAWTVALTLGP